MKLIKINWVLALVVTTLLFNSCKKEREIIDVKTQKNVSFSSSISGNLVTRAQGTQWESGDAIGVFMYGHGEGLVVDNILNDAMNKQFSTVGNGSFSPKSSTDNIEFPTGQKVDFTAYYPYQPYNTLKPSLDISNQSNQAALDFMSAKQEEGWELDQGRVSLSFQRQMVKVELKVKGAGLAGLNALFKGVPVNATFHLSENILDVNSDIVKDIQAKIVSTGPGESILQWTIFPRELSSANTIVFLKADGSKYTWKIDAGTTFVKGHRYLYDVTLGKDSEVDPTPNGAYMELPIILETETLKYSLKMSNDSRRNYSMLYDTKYKVAQWVAYPLSGDYLGNIKRTDDWQYDPDYNSSLQALLNKGYPNNSSLSIDRGHQLPSGDRTKTYAENASTFYYTNITPQNRSLNQGVWNDLETKVRSWTEQSGVDTMYVVTGGMMVTNTDKIVDYVKDNAGKDVAKPKYYYKVLAMKKGEDYYTIGFRFDNKTPGNRDYMSYKLTVTDVEKETGFTFFPSLSSEIKSTINTNVWR